MELPPSSGFEALVPSVGSGSQDFFFSQWISDPDAAAAYLERGGDPRDSVFAELRTSAAASGVFHLLVLLWLFLGQSLLGLFVDQTEPVVVQREEERPLLLFIEEPEPEPEPELPPKQAEAEREPLILVPVTPEPAPATPPEPPQVADDRLLIPKAMLAPDERQEFMNDLPFSRGNTEDFYTDEEVKDPGEEGAPEEAVAEALPELVPLESGEDDRFAEARDGPDRENRGADLTAKRLDPRELGDILSGLPGLEEKARPRREIPEPEARPTERERRGQGGENGEFTDIRRFLAGARFHNPEGGLVSNTNNTLYYNDKGANFVPWIRRLINEVRRGWMVPQSVLFEHGHVAIGVTVDRSGNVTNLTMLIPSGVSGFDNAALGALRSVQGRLLPLPADYPDPTFDIILVFWYNEKPYDIF